MTNTVRLHLPNVKVTNCTQIMQQCIHLHLLGLTPYQSKVIMQQRHICICLPNNDNPNHVRFINTIHYRSMRYGDCPGVIIFIIINNTYLRQRNYFLRSPLQQPHPVCVFGVLVDFIVQRNIAFPQKDLIREHMCPDTTTHTWSLQRLRDNVRNKDSHTVQRARP